ncbi:hypothetical protein T03_4583 [Trichinella britovi]|uniref:Uncharacterized protein n=1 Tax=Trichinella britovi TaxID=45882 RepID=A0A0V1AKG5_TRIBR|nr:hypothetical protein T03_4583 [Trichinella britovi]
MIETTVSGHSMEYNIAIRNLPAEIMMDTAFWTGRQ